MRDFPLDSLQEERDEAGVAVNYGASAGPAASSEKAPLNNQPETKPGGPAAAPSGRPGGPHVAPLSGPVITPENRPRQTPAMRQHRVERPCQTRRNPFPPELSLRHS